MQRAHALRLLGLLSFTAVCAAAACSTSNVRPPPIAECTGPNCPSGGAGGGGGGGGGGFVDSGYPGDGGGGGSGGDGGNDAGDSGLGTFEAGDE